MEKRGKKRKRVENREEELKRVEKERKGVKNREEVCKRVEKKWKIEKKSGK